MMGTAACLRSAEHHRVSLTLGHISTNGDQVTELLAQQDDAVAQRRPTAVSTISLEVAPR